MINFNKNQKRELILIEYFKRLKCKKSELKKKILQTIFKNKNQKTKYKIAAQQMLCEKHTTSFNIQQNRCLFTGRIKGFHKNLWASRQSFKKLMILGDVQNLKKKSW